jgi:hypothetical protein
MPLLPLPADGTNRSFTSIAIDFTRDVLFLSDSNNGEILRVRYTPFIYEQPSPKLAIPVTDSPPIPENPEPANATNTSEPT